MIGLDRRPTYYALDGREPRPATPEEVEGLLVDATRRRVGLDRIDTPAGIMTVSTVFLAIDHNMTGRGPPVLFETMIFLGDDPGGIAQYRYVTWHEAEQGHARAVAWVRAGCPEESVETEPAPEVEA